MPCYKALFQDRDGVINFEGCYIHTRHAFRFQNGIFDLCRAAQALEYLLVVLTNQAGIARGYTPKVSIWSLPTGCLQTPSKSRFRLRKYTTTLIIPFTE